MITLFEEFELGLKYKAWVPGFGASGKESGKWKGYYGVSFGKQRILNPMEKGDDISSNIIGLLYKAYENDCLYVTQLYGNIVKKLYIGANYALPYSDGSKREIGIYINNYDPVEPVVKIDEDDPYGEEDWNPKQKNVESPTVQVHDGPKNGFRGETDNVDPYIGVLEFTKKMVGTKFDKTKISEAVAVSKFMKPEKLPKVAEMEGRGYRVATLSDGEKYAFSKDYVEQDDIYWLGQNTNEYQYGLKYIATADIISNKKNLPFYSIYSKCDPSPTDHQKKVLSQREKENAAKQKELQKNIRGENKPRPKKK